MGTGSYQSGTGGTASAGAGAALGGAAGSFWGPVGYGVGTAAGSVLGSALSGSGSVNFRGKYARNQLKHQEKIWQSQRDQMGPDMRSRVLAVKSAGLHPLAALGITPSASGPASQPMLPGQSPNYGSAISEGLQTAQNLSLGNQRSAQSRTIAGLQVEEQQLRNDFLREQIKASEMGRMTQLANQMRPPVQNRPHPTEGERFTMMSPGGKKYSVRGGTSAQQLEDQIAEWANLMPDTMGRAWDTFKAQIQNSFGDDYRRGVARSNKRRDLYRKHFSNPTPYKGMGKTHY